MAEKELREWIRRLESGEYEQCGTVLSHVDSDGVRRYCCLGIAGDYAAEEGIIPPPRVDEDGDYEYGGKFCTLPALVSSWLGITGGVKTDCINLNDSGKSFPEIAAYLRRTYGIEG